MPDGRAQRFGERNSSYKLTNEQVKRIRARRRQGARGTDLAQRYGVHRDTIYRICNGKAREHG